MIKVFQYIEQLDAFVCTPVFKEIVETLGLAEWTPAVWIGRYFLMDNDYGEHYFDQHDERDAIAEKAKELGYDSYDLLIVRPQTFTPHIPYCVQCGKQIEKPHCPTCNKSLHVADGPCHSDAMRKRFWTDVMKSLQLSFDTIAEEARINHADNKDLAARYGADKFPDAYSLATAELEERIEKMRAKHDL